MSYQPPKNRLPRRWQDLTRAWCRTNSDARERIYAFEMHAESAELWLAHQGITHGLLDALKNIAMRSTSYPEAR